ncbi:hypothetical protein HED60_23155 [Planctomycetales bacterium ZRK34]|nr:hypothetical protein HED60_23155 [Planctomycetales bacterium ZRK34]
MFYTFTFIFMKGLAMLKYAGFLAVVLIVAVSTTVQAGTGSFVWQDFSGTDAYPTTVERWVDDAWVSLERQTAAPAEYRLGFSEYIDFTGSEAEYFRIDGNDLQVLVFDGLSGNDINNVWARTLDGVGIYDMYAGLSGGGEVYATVQDYQTDEVVPSTVPTPVALTGGGVLIAALPFFRRGSRRCSRLRFR